MIGFYVDKTLRSRRHFWWSPGQFSNPCDDTSIFPGQSPIGPTGTVFGNQDFSIEGHIEYIGERDNELDHTIEAHLPAQPQFRWNTDKAWFETPKQLFVGFEYQYWRNKLGDKDTDESATQLLLVWRF